MAENKEYWTGMEELHQTDAFVKAAENEFQEDLPVSDFVQQSGSEELSSGRRDFLKFLGFGVGAATLAACETPVTRVIPYVNKPEEITPGLPTYYASTYFDGYDYASILVKTREGRPIFIKGNKDFGMGAVNARINASVLSLYDGSRLQGPKSGSKAISWTDADNAIAEVLASTDEKGGRAVLLTSSLPSPSSKASVKALAEAYPGIQMDHLSYDARSFEAMRHASKDVLGAEHIPFFDFDKAKVVVGVGADFMNDFPLSAQYTHTDGARRKPEGDWMNQHFQFEALMSMTGSNADYRTAIKPSEEGQVLAAIYNHITGRGSSNAASEMTEAAADALKSAKGASLVLSGSNDKACQVLAMAIYEALGNIGRTVLPDTPVRLSLGTQSGFEQLVSDMESGRVDVLMLAGVNPAYDSSIADRFRSALEKVGTSISFNSHADETASLCDYQLPSNHALESWNDYNVVGGHYALCQPTIQPLFDTRQWQSSFLAWSGRDADYMAFMKEAWMGLASQQDEHSPTEFWNHSLHNGSVDINTALEAVEEESADEEIATESASGMAVDEAIQSAGRMASSSDGMELVMYTSTAVGTGSHAPNPWLQELPDPITKVCWDNYVTMSLADVMEKGFQMYLGQESPATLVDVTVGDKTLRLPVVPVPGQKSGTLGIALGYGRGEGGEEIGNAAYQISTEIGFGYTRNQDGNKMPIGVNAFPMVETRGGTSSYMRKGASVSDTGETYPIAATQTHHTVMERHSVVKEVTLADFKTKPSETYNKPHTLAMHENGETVQKPVSEVDLWNDHPVEEVGHWWGLSIDLSSCLGCGACITACHSENNVPVVGKDEVRRARDMHWLRIDRYFSSDMTKEKAEADGMSKIAMYREMEKPGANPTVVHMPMMCQHCNHAPCETVCPVAATTHSNEGINQMTYNRCIGTRYCANNCPYKVRRFNWFNYKAYSKFSEVNPSQDVLGRMVLNPDVTVRSRGVMEKCSMCMQRIQAGKLDAKLNSTPVPDGSIQTACSEACPNDCITFGDVNDKESAVAKRFEDKRTYFALEEVGTKPSVSYMVKVRNKEELEA
jgi:molybdopterin-containing oxidoreductase family iron-sulfur binding subunit